jgi:site-specific recombinase XerC
MALEAVQAQAGHASIESTRIYLHLADDWLASQYRPTLQAQHDHAAEHDQPHRADLFTRLLDGLDQQA